MKFLVFLLSVCEVGESLLGLDDTYDDGLIDSEILYWVALDERGWVGRVRGGKEGAGRKRNERDNVKYDSLCVFRGMHIVG